MINENYEKWNMHEWSIARGTELRVITQNHMENFLEILRLQYILNTPVIRRKYAMNYACNTHAIRLVYSNTV